VPDAISLVDHYTASIKENLFISNSRQLIKG